jgi:hypothetical protein
MRWLWSSKAIKCHVLFWIVDGIFVSLCLGNKAEMQKILPGNDWIWLLLFLVVGYPFVLFLLWFEQRHAIRVMAHEAVEILTEPKKVKARRVKWRRGSLLGLVAAGGVAVYFGHCGLLIEDIPGQHIGYFLLGIASLGMCGVNIWYGGPINPRFDPQIEESNNTRLPEDLTAN